VVNGRRRAIAVLVTGACVIGLAPILVRLSGAGPAATGFWRLLFSLPILALLSWRAMGGLAAPSRFTLVAGAAFAFDLAFWHYGIANTSVSKATVLGNITPVVVTAVAWLVFHTRPAPLFLVAVALSVTGAAVMAFAKGAGAIGPNPLLGDILSLVTSVWYAIYFLAVGAARRHHGATQVMFWSSLTGVPVLLAAAWLLDEQVLPRAAGGWVACVALAGVHVGGQGAIAWSLGRLTPATAAVTVLVQPVVTTILGWVLFGELLSAWQTVGAVLALGGVVLAQQGAAAGADAPHADSAGGAR
jgi:drug/metabolite transporter (DMT)-like permease